MKIIEMKNKNNEKVLPDFIEQKVSNSKIKVPSSYAVNILKNKNYQVLEAGTNIDELKEQWDNRMYAIFGATGTLPSGYTTDNNIFIQTIMWASDYGRQILYDIRTTKIFTRNLSAGNWKNWVELTQSYSSTELTSQEYGAWSGDTEVTATLNNSIDNYDMIVAFTRGDWDHLGEVTWHKGYTGHKKAIYITNGTDFACGNIYFPTPTTMKVSYEAGSWGVNIYRVIGIKF